MDGFPGNTQEQIAGLDRRISRSADQNEWMHHAKTPATIISAIPHQSRRAPLFTSFRYTAECFLLSTASLSDEE